MVEQESIPEVTQSRIDALGPVDAVIGLTDCDNDAALGVAVDAVRAARREGGKSGRTLILYPDSAGDVPDESGDGAVERIPYAAWRPDLSRGGITIDSKTMLSVAAASRKLEARACCVWNSPAQALTPSAVQWFLCAVEAEGFDLAVPRYTHGRFGSLINSGIVAPLTRTLYGQRIPYPMAPDLCLSPRLVEELLRPDPKTGQPRAPQWVPSQAACLGFRLCAVELGMPPPSAAATGDLSSVLSAVLGSLFQDVEKNATFWQRTRESQPLRRFGDAGAPPAEPGAFAVQPMIEGFQLAYRNMGELWGLVLPPATMLELKKLTRVPEASFRLADGIWARVVFDFLLGQRQRVMNRDHLLRALTPIYLAWVASYAIEARAATPAQAMARLEQLAQAYEAQKPYLLSRWRWPDRFNP